MGLSLQVDDRQYWKSTYSAFGDFRREVERASGITTESLLDKGFTEANVQGLWAEKPREPLAFLFIHSDCDGVIEAEDAEVLANRLEGLLPNFSEDWTEDVEVFIDTLRAAVDTGQQVEFW